MSDFFTKIVNLLANAHISSPRLEAREIMAFALNKNRSEIYSGCVIDDRQKAVVLNLVKKRIAHYPLDKLIGRKGFYKNEFITNENVLSPRPETEILVEKTLELKPKNAPTNILDLGTGSGCIIESILAERTLWRGVAVDISADALDVARKNAQLLEVDNRLRFIQASWFDDDFFAKQGRVFYELSPKFYKLIIWQFAIRKYKLYRKKLNIFQLVKIMNSEIEKGASNEKN